MTSIPILHASAETLEADLLAARGALLLDCWASWCAPCRVLAPLLERAAHEYGEALRIAKLDVDAHPALASRLGVRGVPLLILFRDGQEQARRAGTLAPGQLRQWLGHRGVHPPGNARRAPDGHRGTASPGGSFHGDAELRHFLLQRLRRHAGAGELTAARLPWWREGRGTVSAALVHSDRPQDFERLAGLPFSLACALHFAGVAAEAEVAQVGAALHAGREYGDVAPALAEDWLGDAANDWPRVLADERLDALRRRWLQARGRAVTSAAEWHALRRDAWGLRSARDPRRAVQDAFVDMLAGLCPLPDPDDDGAWTAALLKDGGLLRIVIVQAASGWSQEEIATDALRFAWFQAQEALEPGGRLGEARLRQLREQWEGENRAWTRKWETFCEQLPALAAPYGERLRRSLVGRLEAAPPATG